MHPEFPAKSKLARIVGYAAVGLVAAWSLLALAGYAILGGLARWIASIDAADGWIAWSGQLVGQAGGPVVGVLWLLGTLIILGAAMVIRRFAA